MKKLFLTMLTMATSIVAWSENITFADANVKALCVANWDTNGDGELSETEAAAVTTLGSVFDTNSTITSFNELKYFTKLTSISFAAFRFASKLTSVTLPKNLKAIGNQAFYSTAIKSIDIPASVNSIGDYAFSGCNNLNSVIVRNPNPVSITASTTFSSRSNATLYVPIGSKANFTAADYWKEFNKIVESDPSAIVFTDAKVKAICVANWDTNGDGELSDAEAATVTDLGNVFQRNTEITSFNELKFFTGLQFDDQYVSGNTYSGITGFAFTECTNLKQVTLPYVEAIGDGAFMKSGLTAIVIPNSVKIVRDGAFSGTAISSFVLPAAVTDITNGIVEDCPNLESIVVESGNTVYDSRNNCNAIIKTANNELIIGCANTTIPATVTSIRDYAFQNCKGLQTVVISDNVTTIGRNAFAYSGITSLSIGKGLSSIGNNAFTSLDNLTSITVDAENATYDSRDNCNAIVKKSNSTLVFGCGRSTIPASVTAIGESAFWECGNLAAITIPATVTTIGNSAFWRCKNLTSVTVEWTEPISLSSSGVFSTDLTGNKATLYVPVGSKATYEAATGWKDFKEIVEGEVPSPNITFADANVKAICVTNWDSNGDGELSEAEAAAVTDIGDVFKENTEITSFDEFRYFSGVTELPSWRAFEGCSALKSIIIPAGVTSIDGGAFANCPALEKISVEAMNGIYESPANCNAIVEKSTNKLVVGCNTTTIPNTVTTIGDASFWGRFGMTSMDIPESVTVIEPYAFTWCANLSSVSIPASVTTIGSNAFCYTGLISVTLPATLTDIGDEAFNGCSNLTTVIVENPTPVAISEEVFSNRANATLIVPAGSKAAYEAADYWKEFKQIAEPREIWAGSQVIDWANSLVNISKEDLNSLNVGDEIHIVVKDITEGATSDNWMAQVSLKDGEWSNLEASTLLDEKSTKEVSYILTGDMLRSIKATGIVLTGDGYTATRVYAVPSPYTGSENSIWIGAQTYAAYITEHHLAKAHGKRGVVPGDIIRLTFDKYDDASVDIHYCGDITNWGLGDFENLHIDLTETGADITLTESMAKLLNGNQLVVNGHGIKLTQVELIEKDITWTNLVVNSDMEGTETTCYFARYNGGDAVPATIVDGTGFWGSRGIVVESSDSDTDDWSTQFFIRLPQPLPAGTIYSLKFDYWASQETAEYTEIHREPMEWICGYGPFVFHKDRNVYQYTGVVTAEQDGMQTFAFSLSMNRSATKFYFDNIYFDVENNLSISFADANVKVLCVDNWDVNKDGELSITEAAAVTDLGTVFKGNTEITSFNELQYFTGLTAIANNAFKDCSNLASVTFPEGLETIGASAFRGSGLTAVKMPGSLTRISKYAFRNCHQLANVDFNNCPAHIYQEAFAECDGLTEITVPATCTMEEWNHFAYCDELKSATILAQGEWGHGMLRNNPKLETVVLASANLLGENTFGFGTSAQLKTVTILEGGSTGRRYEYVMGTTDQTGCRFIIPEGTAESFLQDGYINLSDKSALPNVKAEYEAEVARVQAMAGGIKNGDKEALASAISTANEAVNMAEEYPVIFAQIAAVKDAAKAFIATATLSANTDVTAAMVTNPDFDRYLFGWTPLNYGAPMWWKPVEYSNGDVSVNNFIEKNTGEDNMENIKQYQIVKDLPAGYYRLECDAIATWQQDASVEVTGVSLFAGSQETAIATANEKPQHFTVDFSQSEQADVEIGVKVLDGNVNWVAFDNVRLIYLGAYGNKLYAADLQTSPGATTLLEINLDNKDEVKLCQFDLRLPAGVTVATKSNGKLDVTLTERAKGHTVSSNLLENGDYSFVISKLNNESFTGNDGTLLEIKLNIPADMEAADYTVKVLNSELSVSEGNTLKVVKPAESESKLTVKAYTPGDVNSDGKVSVTDVGSTINYILKRQPAVFSFDAADVNSDKDITVTDVGLIINIILHGSVSPAPRRTGIDNLCPQLALQQTADGYALTMDGKDAFIGFQFDVKMTDGATINSMQLKNGQDHLMTYRKLDDDTYRVVCYSMSNSCLADQDAALVNISATGNITISDVRLTTTAFEELNPLVSEGLSTGIANLNQGMKISVNGRTLQIVADRDTTVRLYTLGGSVYRVLNVHSGVNTFEGLKAGVYMIENKKMIIR